MPPESRTLPIPAGYDATVNPRLASFAAQLDDQLAHLERTVASFEPAQLEWQPRPGVNTVGMLLAHLAIVDLWWISLAPTGMTWEAAEDRFRQVLGIGPDDDGLPLAADGRHPDVLKDKPVGFYLALLHHARAATHAVLCRWRDADLSSTYVNRERQISYEWTVYHVLEHFAAHAGQILLLVHLMRDAGVMPRETTGA